jgi:hypothetical protein
MFKQTISILLLSAMPFSMAVSAEFDFIPVPLQKVDNDGEHPGQRSPEDYSFLPTILYNEAAETLSVIGNADLGAVPYTITDEDDNVVLSGILMIANGTQTNLSIASLPTGDYTLYVIIDDKTYVGVFSK